MTCAQQQLQPPSKNITQFSDDDSISTDATDSTDDDDEELVTVDDSGMQSTSVATPSNALRTRHRHTADATPTTMHFVPNQPAPGGPTPHPPPTADAVGRRTRARVDLSLMELEQLEAALDDRVDVPSEGHVDWTTDRDYLAFLAAIRCGDQHMGGIPGMDGDAAVPATAIAQDGSTDNHASPWGAMLGWEEDEEDDDFCIDVDDEDDDLLDYLHDPPPEGVMRMTRRSLFLFHNGERVVESVALLHHGAYCDDVCGDGCCSHTTLLKTVFFLADNPTTLNPQHRAP